MRPPPQPKLPQFCEQSTKFCSEREVSGLPASAHCPSNDATVEKAQHEPHWPWSLIGVTTGGFAVRQSAEARIVEFAAIVVGVHIGG